MSNYITEELQEKIDMFLSGIYTDYSDMGYEKTTRAEAEKEVTRLIHNEANKRVAAVLERLEEQAIDAQYYIPNSPDDTYTSGEVVRLSNIKQEKERLLK